MTGLGNQRIAQKGATVKMLLGVGQSRIAGKGLFAAQNIKKGTRIIQYAGPKIPKRESLARLAQGNVYIFSFNDRFDIDGKDLKNTARYINHSCDPNCEVEITKRSIWIVALRDITAGAELSYNYGYGIEAYEEHPCRCRAENCCGYMLAKEHWHLLPKRRRKRGMPHT
jgi:uncharacterized protein